MTQKHLELLKDCYQVLGNSRNMWEGRATQKGQSLLCNLRDTIAEETGKSSEEVQNTLD